MLRAVLLAAFLSPAAALTPVQDAPFIPSDQPDGCRAQDMVQKLEKGLNWYRFIVCRPGLRTEEVHQPQRTEKWENRFWRVYDLDGFHRCDVTVRIPVKGFGIHRVSDVHCWK